LKGARGKLFEKKFPPKKNLLKKFVKKIF